MNDIAPPSDKEFRKEAIGLALSYTPTIHPCAECKWPVIEGYCCKTCDSANPRGYP